MLTSELLCDARAKASHAAKWLAKSNFSVAG
jgi:hypothetical protein